MAHINSKPETAPTSLLKIKSTDCCRKLPFYIKYHLDLGDSECIRSRSNSG